MGERGESLETRIDEAAGILASCRSLVISTGAGMSKESGIPTFRDAPNALWDKFDPEELASPEGFLRNPPLVWKWYEERRRMIAEAEPNAGHRAIAAMEDLFDDFTLITQNIDDLHRKAGSKNIIEIHGNIFSYKCFDNEHPLDHLPPGDEIPPRCRCGSLVRPDVVWFGEQLPQEALDEAYAALHRCDAVLVVGTSGIVVPAAYFPSIAKSEGAVVIELNPQPSQITHQADIFLQGQAGIVMPGLLEKLRKKK